MVLLYVRSLFSSNNKSKKKNWRYEEGEYFSPRLTSLLLLQWESRSVKPVIMVVACVDRYRKLIRVARICAAICGADVADENYNPWNPLVFITLSSIVFFTVGTGYTIYAGLVYDNDWTVILQSLCLASSAFQGLAKYMFSLIRRRLIVNIIKSIDDIYLECQNISENYRVILAKTVSVAMTGMKLIGFLYTITATSLVLFPLLYQLIFGKRLFIMRFLIPGLNPNSTMGYLLHMLIQFILIEHISELYNEIIFIEILLCCLGVCCTMFSIVLSLSAWPAAPVYLIFTLAAMYVYCVLGYTIEKASDKLLLNIYIECLWYELTVQQQQMILLMLIKSQSPVVLNIVRVSFRVQSSELTLSDVKKNGMEI
ncbi:hypothetical protein GQX74_004281 [Glossina fuscipes]|nr:hypothetical protein GQX74_004281 [Glossina fuscipes]